MSKAGKIISINPPHAIPGGEVIIECEGFQIDEYGDYACVFAGEPARIVGASSKRILAVVPESLTDVEIEVHLESGGAKSKPFPMKLGRKLADDLHQVANPAARKASLFR